MRHPRFGIHPSWVIVFAGVCAALHVGKLPPALPVLQDALNITLVQAGFLLSAVQVASMTLGLAVGLSADSLGLRRSMLVGLGLLSFASISGGFVADASGLLFLRALEGLGFLLVVMPAPALIRRTVDASQLSGRMGWWGTYMPTGSALALLLGPWVIAGLNWSAWWWLLGAVAAFAWVAVWLCVPDVQPLVPTHNVANDAWPKRLALTLQSPGPWLVALTFAVYSSQWLAVVGFLPTVYAELGLAAGTAGVLSACVALANVSGNIMSGRLLQRGWPAQRLLSIGFACMALGAVGAYAVWQGEGLPTSLRFACVVMFSAVGGLIPGTLFSCALRLAPSEGTVSTTVGYMQQLSALGQFAGPPLVAWVAASAGGWQWTWTVTATLSLAGAVLAHFIGRALHKKEKHD
ncbi:MFS transporter [Limnohabitans sp. Rim8]|jgi:CP family cyanate transporter-like MFS transporter|uniref:MFS transporter n=1 Tax=Limnohabitans curvus TaxID=323423 RepID=A0A315EQC8_9BURK|nr:MULTISPECIES: MFS transporter [Limnohabitans]PUE59038.1 MFS transporter [Limnohabitans curvus]PUE62282.1 MFS transporter [Limnohabitans sp. Rim8]